MSNLINLSGYLIAGFLGAVIGSFLNVCIYRIPRSQSIVFPGSHCPTCGKSIAFYDNIPILSYLLLRGKCRNCRAPISFRYPLVEALNAAFYLILFSKFGWAPDTWMYGFFVSALIVISFIDLDFRIIPDRLSLGGILLGFAASFLIRRVTPLQSLFGILLGGGFLFLVASLYEKIAHKEGMGGGDIKLLAMIGAFLGWQAIPFVILVSSFVGAFLGIIMIIILKKDAKFAIPFGPFLSFGAILYLFIGQEIVHWYLNLGRVGG